MVSTLFQNFYARFISRAPRVIVNEGGGPAFPLTPEAALAQLATTGTFHPTYYTSGADQLLGIRTIADQVSTEYLAKLTLYARETAAMKDMPAALLGLLALRPDGGPYFEALFPVVINSPKMLRSFTQIWISKALGNKGKLTGRVQRVMRGWFARQSAMRIFDATGTAPAMRDVLALVHPKPRDVAQEAVFAYLMKPEGERTRELLPNLPPEALHYLAWLSDKTLPLPKVTFERLMGQDLSAEQWVELALTRTSYFQLLNSLQTLQRHRVFANGDVIDQIAQRLAKPEVTGRGRVQPYRFLVAHRTLQTLQGIPRRILNAVQDGLEAATTTAPAFPAHTWLLVDVSGSMSSPITGQRGSATSAVRAVDVASLMASILLRTTPSAEVIGFGSTAGMLALNSRDSVVTNAGLIAGAGAVLGHGTDIAAGLRFIRAQKRPVGQIILLTDMQTWLTPGNRQHGTGEQAEWIALKSEHPGAKIVAVNLQAYANTPLQPSTPDVLYLGGFNDQILGHIGEFLAGEWSPAKWQEAVASTVLPSLPSQSVSQAE